MSCSIGILYTCQSLKPETDSKRPYQNLMIRGGNHLKSIIRLLKLYLKKKNQCLPGYEQGFRPPRPRLQWISFFSDIDLCTRSLNKHLMTIFVKICKNVKFYLSAYFQVTPAGLSHRHHMLDLHTTIRQLDLRTTWLEHYMTCSLLDLRTYFQVTPAGLAHFSWILGRCTARLEHYMTYTLTFKSPPLDLRTSVGSLVGESDIALRQTPC